MKMTARERVNQLENTTLRDVLTRIVIVSDAYGDDDGWPQVRDALHDYSLTEADEAPADEVAVDPEPSANQFD